MACETSLTPSGAALLASTTGQNFPEICVAPAKRFRRGKDCFMTVWRQARAPQTKKFFRQFDDVTRLKYQSTNVGPRESSQLSGSHDADIDRDRCLASAGEWRCAHADLARACGCDARRRHGLPHSGRLSLDRCPDLPGIAHRTAEPA